MSHCCLKGDAAERQSVVNGYEQNAKNEIEEVELTCSVQDSMSDNSASVRCSW